MFSDTNDRFLLLAGVAFGAAASAAVFSLMQVRAIAFPCAPAREVARLGTATRHDLAWCAHQ